MKIQKFAISGRGFIIAEIKSDKNYSEKEMEPLYKTKGTFGKIAEITEQGFSGIVEKWDNGKFESYSHFLSSEDSAKESFFSKLNAIGLLFSNPYKHPNEICSKKDDGNFFQRISAKKYLEAQSRVWDINDTYLFESQ